MTRPCANKHTSKDIRIHVRPRNPTPTNPNAQHTVVQRRVAPLPRPLLVAEVPPAVRLRELLQVLQIPIAGCIQHRQPHLLVAGPWPVRLRLLRLLLGRGLRLLGDAVVVGHACVVVGGWLLLLRRRRRRSWIDL